MREGVYSINNILLDLISSEEITIKALEKEVRKNEYGNLYIKKKANSTYFAEYTGEKQVWITKKEERVYRVARHQYAKEQLKEKQKVYDVLMSTQKKIDEISEKSKTSKLLDKFSMLDLGRVISSTEDLKWQENYTANPFRPEALKYATTNGKKMRSKSERLIGNALEKYDISYRYEPRVIIDGKEYYPDFVIRCLRNRFVIWEHFGMMDNEEYRSRAFYKVMQYRKAGFRQFDNLICTWEEDLESMDTVDEIIRRYVLL